MEEKVCIDCEKEHTLEGDYCEACEHELSFGHDEWRDTEVFLR